LILGSVTGSRTFGAWGVLAVRGRVKDDRLRIALLVALAGELIADKHPAAQPRSEPRGLAGRIVSGALAGRLVAGGRGAAAGAGAAGAMTLPTERARAMIGRRTSIPDPALGAIEDLVVLGIAGLAAGA
jgi:uncharacterized membrane protein